jgi:hypothetical protein
MFAMTSYSVRIFDLSVGRFIFSAPGFANPYRVGQVTAGAMASLVTRDGRRYEDLELCPAVAHGSRLRPMTPLETSAMEAGLEQFGPAAPYPPPAASRIRSEFRSIDSSAPPALPNWGW